MADGKVVIKADFDGDKAQSGIGKLKSLLGGLENTGSRVGSVFKSVLGANLIGSALTNGISALTSGLSSMVGEINSSAKSWKTFEGNLRAFGRSEEVIASAKKEMQDYAATTVYSASEMAGTYAQLDAVGTKNVGSLVKAFGGLAASAENPAQAMKSLSTQATQMASKPKVAWMDFKIMMEQAPAGMAAVAEQMGMSTAELVAAVQDGKVKTEDFFDALNRAGNSDAFQRMATEFKTIDQAIDGMREGLANKLLPVFDKFNNFGIKAVNAVSDALNKINFDKMAEGLGKFLDGIDVEGIVSKVSNTISSLVSKVQTFWSSFSNTGAVSAFIGAIQSVAGAFGKVFSSLTASGVLTTLGSALGNVVKWLSQATTAAANFISSLPSGVIQAIASGFLGLVAGFKAFNFLQSFNPFNFFRKNADEAFNGAANGAKRSKSTISQIFNGLSNVVKSLGTALKSTFQGMGAMFTGLGKTFEGFGKGLGAALKGLMQGLRGLNPATLLSFGASVGIAAIGIGTGIAIISAGFALLATQSQGVSEILQAIGGVVVSVGTAIGTILNQAIQGLAQGLVIVAPVLPTITSAFAQLSPLITAAGEAVSMVISAFGSLSPVVTALGVAISQVVSALSSGIAEIITAATPIVEILGNVFTTVAQIVADAIVRIVQALAPFIPSLTEMVVAVAPVLDSLVQAFTTLIEQVSPIIDSLTQLLRTFGEQVSSILESAGGVVESFGSAIRNVLDGVAGIFESMGNAAKNAGQGVKLMAQGIKILVDLKLGDLVGTLEAVATGLAAIASSGIASAGPGLQKAGTGLMLIATSAQMASVAIQALPGVLSSLSSSVGTLPSALTTAGTAMTAFASAAIISFAGLAGSTAGISALQGRLSALTATMLLARSSAMQLATSLPMVASGFTSISTAATSAMSQLNAAVRSAMTQAVSTMRSNMTQMVSVVRQSASQMTQAGQQAGRGVSNGVTNGIRAGIGSATAAMSSMMAAIQSVGMAGTGSMRYVGAMIGQGLAQGMYSALGAVTAAANALVAQAERAAQAKAKIHSPSRLFRDNVGRYIAQGIAVGIEENTSDVTASLANVQREMLNYRFSPEELLSNSSGSIVRGVKLKFATDSAETGQMKRLKERGEELVQHALKVAEEAVKRPVNMIMDTGAMIGSIGEPITRHQNDKLQIENLMWGIK